MEEPIIYLDDICRRKSGNHNPLEDLCNVERTFMDVQGHSRHPAERYDHPIRRHQQVSTDDFQRFLRNGRPPAGTVLVHWHRTQVPELMPTSELEIYHRYVGLGDTVKKVTREPMGGTVIGKELFYDLTPIIGYGENGYHPRTHSPPWRITHVPYEELKLSEEFIPPDWIIYNDWFGTIQEHWDEAFIHLNDDSVIQLDTDNLKLSFRNSSGYYTVGSWVGFSPHYGPSAKFARGKYSPEVPPYGIIIALKTTKIRVRWHCIRLGGDPNNIKQPEPPPLLDSKVLNSGEVHLVNWSRTPKNPFAVRNHIEFRMDETVRFRDLQAACRKYSGQTPPNCHHSPRCKNDLKMLNFSSTAGFDANVFKIGGGYSRVTVRWEDLSVSTHSPTELFLDQDFESANDIFPGQLVIPNPEGNMPRGNQMYRVPKIGVVQAMNASERFATVHWSTTSNVEYLDHNGEWVLNPIPETGIPIKLPPNGTGQCEDVSLYDIKPAPQICRSLRDIVIIVKPVNHIWNGRDGKIDWIGQVVEMRLDGVLIVRTETLDKTIQDLEIAPQHVYMIIPGVNTESASTDGSEMDDDDDSNSFVAEEDQIDFAEPLDVWVENDQGERVDMNSEDEDDWSTDYSSDVEMNDKDDDNDADEKDMEESHIQVLPKSSIEDQIPEPMQVEPTSVYNTDSKADSPPEEAPLRFEILESLPPNDHRFVTQVTRLAPTQVRRVRKEHTMLFGNLPDGIYVRTWESRLDLIRVLFVGPVETPYEFAPFVIDLYLGSSFPHEPPEAHFHSWVFDGQGSINPNLYEEGKVCLSLLNTWQADKRSESWNSARSSILQLAVSILGLVLVEEPYFNEAGYDVLAKSADSKHRSEAYSERTYFRSRKFIAYALQHGVESMKDVIAWLYRSKSPEAPLLLDKAIDAVQDIVDKNGEGEISRGGLKRVGKGAVIMFRRELEVLKRLKAEEEKTGDVAQCP